MPAPPVPPHPTRGARLALAALAIVVAAGGPAPARAQDGAGLEAGTVRALGLENVTLEARTSPPRVAFENRRYRHPLDAVGRLERAAGQPVEVWIRRLGLTAARFAPVPGSAGTRFLVSHPSDPGFVRPPAGPRLRPTSHSLDLELDPLLDYEVGRIYTPVQLRIQLEPRVRMNPWPGARATLGVIFPVHDDFRYVDRAAHPDLDRVRPGRMTLEQYLWLPEFALASATAGVFDDNRWGVSFGLARPFARGLVLIDTQLDATGFIAFPAGGATYSTPSRLTGFGGITLRPPFYDVALRVRAESYLYGDRGVEVELRRSLGDVDLGFFVTRSAGVDLKGVRLGLPVPPLTRATGTPVRVQPVERYTLDYRTVNAPLARTVAGVASREEFLRQLDPGSLEANRDRLERARTGAPRRYRSSTENHAGLTGMSGFLVTPWAGTLPDRTIELGYNRIPVRWAWDQRGRHANEVWYADVGFLPRVEAAVRFTRIPGFKSFSDLAPDSRLTDTDHMASVRVAVLPPAAGRPGLALGVEDVEGTRRFHSAYAVAGLPLVRGGVHARAAVGYAARVFRATRHILDGTFGAVEVSPWRFVAAQLEYDTEKWNAGLTLAPGFGLELRAAALHLESLSVGLGWQWPL